MDPNEPRARVDAPAAEPDLVQEALSTGRDRERVAASERLARARRVPPAPAGGGAGTRGPPG